MPIMRKFILVRNIFIHGIIEGVREYVKKYEDYMLDVMTLNQQEIG